MKIPTCLCARLRGGGPEAARRSSQSSTAPAGERLSTIVRALLNGLKVLSRTALLRSPGYVAELRRKRFRSARRRRANFGVRPIVECWTHVGKWAHDQAGCCSESGPSALALALFITALPPPSRADVGQPDHDNASAAGLQLEAPLNEHEPVRGGGAGDAAQGDGDGGGGGAGGGGGGSGGDGRGVGPPAFAAGAVGIITAQRRCATRASGRLSTR